MRNNEPVGYTYELAHFYDKEKDHYSGWKNHISFYKPTVPPRSIRNLYPLYKREEE